MYSKEELMAAINLAEDSSSPNKIEYLDQYIISSNFKYFLNNLFLEIERHFLQVEKLIFQPCNKNYISLNLSSRDLYNSNSINKEFLWGCEILYSIFMPQNKILLIAEDPYQRNIDLFDAKYFSLGIMDLDKIRRLENLKGFW